MKTEQEQIEEIVKILVETSKKCRYTDCNNCDYQYVKDCAQYRKAVALVKAGYGDIKQAQIDVLNELKKKTHNYYPSIDSYCISQHVVLVRDIDELMAEVQND